jgi:hypothetical protein
MVERTMQVDDELFAVLSDGALLSQSPNTLRWQRLLPDIPDIKSIFAPI